MTRAALLVDYLNRHQRRLFRPGQHDCALFAAGWVECCTGRDLSAQWRGAYRSLDEGRAELAAEGIHSLADLADQYLTQICGPAASQPGDIALIREAGEDAFGIIGGPHIHVLGLRGLDILPLSRAEQVFRP